jgi:hypothetical protein
MFYVGLAMEHAREQPVNSKTTMWHLPIVHKRTSTVKLKTEGLGALRAYENMFNFIYSMI